MGLGGESGRPASKEDGWTCKAGLSGPHRQASHGADPERCLEAPSPSLHGPSPRAPRPFRREPGLVKACVTSPCAGGCLMWNSIYRNVYRWASCRALNQSSSLGSTIEVPFFGGVRANFYNALRNKRCMQIIDKLMQIGICQCLQKSISRRAHGTFGDVMALSRAVHCW